MSLNIIGEPNNKYGQQEQVSVRNHNRKFTRTTKFKSLIYSPNLEISTYARIYRDLYFVSVCTLVNIRIWKNKNILFLFFSIRITLCSLYINIKINRIQNKTSFKTMKLCMGSINLIVIHSVYIQVIIINGYLNNYGY